MYLNETHKKIYNCFLKHFRNGQPYKRRENFDDFSENNKVYLLKISNLFSKYPHIKWEDYFSSPNYLKPDEKCPNLDFFATRAAIRDYNLAISKKELDNPLNQKDFIIESFKFISKFCISEKIKLDEYLRHKNGIFYTWMLHYKENRINIYCMFPLGDFFSQITQLEHDEKELLFPNFSEKLSKIKINYLNSDEFKIFLKKAAEITEKFVKNNLQP